MLTQEKITQYKEQLERIEAELLREIKEHEKPVEMGSDTESADEEADEAEELGNQLSMAQALKNDLFEVETALQRIRDGKYGICTKCGGEISVDVLDAAPESLLCKDCKQNQNT
jgi:RNA polymerase-binding transcription factor DksA